MSDLHHDSRTCACMYCVASCFIALCSLGALPQRVLAQYGSAPIRPTGSQTMEMRPNSQPGQADVMLTPAAPALNQPQAPVQRPPQQPVAPQEFAPEVLRVLQQWEQFGKRTEKLEGKHSRIVYDDTFQVMKVSQGEFYYESPDKGRLDLKAVDLGKDPAPQKGPNEKMYQVQSETPEVWICDGTTITHISLSRKEYEQVPIPQEAQGQNIIDSPLPFLFGLTVEKARNRYILKTGVMHDPAKGIVHLVAKPMLPGDAAEWSEAEVILDASTFLPTAIKLTAPGNNGTTVYKFSEANRNKERSVFAIFGKDPFHPPLGSFKKTNMSQIQDPNQIQPTSAQQPPRTAIAPGQGMR